MKGRFGHTTLADKLRRVEADILVIAIVVGRNKF
jgi:hypothetical protein